MPNDSIEQIKSKLLEDITPQVVPLWPDAGIALGLKRNTTYSAANRGEIPVVQVCGKKMVSKKQLDRLINGDLAE